MEKELRTEVDALKLDLKKQQLNIHTGNVPEFTSDSFQKELLELIKNANLDLAYTAKREERERREEAARKEWEQREEKMNAEQNGIIYNEYIPPPTIALTKEELAEAQKQMEEFEQQREERMKQEWEINRMIRPQMFLDGKPLSLLDHKVQTPAAPFPTIPTKLNKKDFRQVMPKQTFGGWSIKIYAVSNSITARCIVRLKHKIQKTAEWYYPKDRGFASIEEAYTAAILRIAHKRNCTIFYLDDSDLLTFEEETETNA